MLNMWRIVLGSVHKSRKTKKILYGHIKSGWYKVSTIYSEQVELGMKVRVQDLILNAQKSCRVSLNTNKVYRI